MKSFARWLVMHALKARHRGAIALSAAVPWRLVTALELDRGGRCSIGKGLGLRQGTQILVRTSAELVIGDDVFVNSHTVLACRDSISIGDGVLIGPGVSIFDHDHDLLAENIRESFISAPISIGAGTWIGAGAVILKGVSIGEMAVIGANAVVTGDIPAGSVALGVPARAVGSITQPRDPASGGITP